MKLNQVSNIAVLSHTDLDGHGTEIILKSMGLTPIVRNLDNQEVDSFILKYATEVLNGDIPAPEVLFITDIGPKGEAAEKLEELHKSGKTKVHLFDHHATATELNQYEWATVITEENGVKPCGTSLIYRFLKAEEVVVMDPEIEKALDAFVMEVELYDTWAWKEKNHLSAKTLNDLFWLIGHKAFIKSQVQRIQSGNQSLFTPEEESLLEVETRRINKYLRDKNENMIVIDDFFTDAEGNPLVAGVVQADTYYSELGHFLCNENEEIDFALLLNLTQNKASLRAVKEHIDLVPIVRRYEGGGHPPAAGCKITPMGMEFIEKVMAEIQKR